jgi:hypothetical protein
MVGLIEGYNDNGAVIDLISLVLLSQNEPDAQRLQPQRGAATLQSPSCTTVQRDCFGLRRTCGSPGDPV